MAVPVASHQAQLSPTLPLTLTPVPEDMSCPCCMGLLQHSPLLAPHAPHAPTAACPWAPAPAPRLTGTLQGRCEHPLGVKGLRRLGLVCGEWSSLSSPLHIWIQ